MSDEANRALCKHLDLHAWGEPVELKRVEILFETGEHVLATVELVLTARQLKRMNLGREGSGGDEPKSDDAPPESTRQARDK